MTPYDYTTQKGKWTRIGSYQDHSWVEGWVIPDDETYYHFLDGEIVHTNDSRVPLNRVLEYMAKI